MKEKKPYGFVLENVEGLVNHDRENPRNPIGRTLTTILAHLEDLGYKVTWRVLNAKDFGVPQERKRIYIVGTSKGHPDLDGFVNKDCRLADMLEQGPPVADTKFTRLLLEHYDIDELFGKAVKNRYFGAVCPERSEDGF